MIKYYAYLLVLNDKCFGNISVLFQIISVKLNFRSIFRKLTADKQAVYSLPFALHIGQAIYL